LRRLHLLQTPIQIIDDLAMFLQRAIELVRRFLQLSLQGLYIICLLGLERTRAQAKNQK
jgi:hypothetical protein